MDLRYFYPIQPYSLPNMQFNNVNFNRPHVSNTKVELLHYDLWKKFHECNTEMVITKSGRHMFPKIEYIVSGLDPMSKYYIFLEMRLSSDKRYKFIADSEDGRWAPTNVAEDEEFSFARFFPYSLEPLTGAELENIKINFRFLRLTNNADTKRKRGMLVLHTQHKYTPRLWFLKFDSNLFFLNRIQPNIYNLFYFCEKEYFEYPITSFITVTTYQSKRMTKLKVENNPFARGFREDQLQKTRAKIEKAMKEKEAAQQSKAQETAVEVQPGSCEPSEEQIFRPWQRKLKSDITKDLSTVTEENAMTSLLSIWNELKKLNQQA